MSGIRTSHHTAADYTAMIQFYAPDIQQTLTLPPEDSAHALRVLRMRTGDTLYVVDGRGTRYTCTLIGGDARRAAVAIEHAVTIERVWPADITVAVAPAKHIDRTEWLIEKLVEIGVDNFIPVLCARSERREIKVERLRKIAVSAMKQSLKATMPYIAEMTPLPRLLQQTTAQQRFIGYCDAETERSLLAKALQPRMSTLLLIGPEGDFTPQEVKQCLDAGCRAVTMGDNRLRTETAALVACDTFHIINQIHS